MCKKKLLSLFIAIFYHLRKVAESHSETGHVPLVLDKLRLKMKRDAYAIKVDGVQQVVRLIPRMPAFCNTSTQFEFWQATLAQAFHILIEFQKGIMPFFLLRLQKHAAYEFGLEKVHYYNSLAVGMFSL